jgi:hypothetical protein
MSDNEHTPSSLRDSPAKPVNSDELSVKNSVGEPIPEFRQPSEEGSKIFSFVRRQDAGDVLPNHPSGPKAIKHAKIDERQVATRIRHSFSEPSDAE